MRETEFLLTLGSLLCQWYQRRSECPVLFCTQKTAYEMRISDWSSDVCSSDLSIPLDIIPGTSRCRRASFIQTGGKRRPHSVRRAHRGRPLLTRLSTMTLWSIPRFLPENISRQSNSLPNSL